MALVRQLMVRAGADFSQMRQEMARASNDLRSFKVGIGRAMAGIGTALASVGGLMGLNSAMNDAIKFEALMGTLSGTLGRSMTDFIKWQQTVGNTMGFSKLQVAEMANDYSLQLKTIATSEQDLFNKTKGLIEAAAIIRSKKGMDMVEISDRMRSALNQEADGAMELGIDVRASAIMQSNAYKTLANNAPWAELSAGMQKTILYQHILDSVQNNFGNKVAQNTALLKGNFVAALKDTKLALGQAFLPILNIALPLLTRLARMAEVAFLHVAAFMRALFPKANIAAGAATTSVVNSQSAAVGGLGDAYKDAGKDATDAAKAAKKAAGSLLGFDEVNTLTKPSADSGADAAGAGDVGGGMAIPGIDMGGFEKSLEVSDKIKDMVANMKKAFRDLAGDGNIKKLIDAFGNMRDSFKDLGTAIANFVNNPVVQKVGDWIAKTLGGNFMRARISDMQLLSGTFEGWAGNIEMLDGLLSLDFDKFFGGFEKWGKGVSESVEGFIRIFSSDMADKFGSFREKFGEAWKGMREDIKKYGDPTRVEISDFGDWIKDTLSKKWTELRTVTANKWEEIKNTIDEKWVKTEKEVSWDSLGQVVLNAWTAIKTRAGLEWESIKQTVAARWNDMLTFIHWDDIKVPVNNVWTAVKTRAGEAWIEIRQTISDRWETFKTAISWDSMKTLVSNTWTGVKTVTGAKWDEIKATVSDKWDAVTKIDLSGILTAMRGIWKDLTIMTDNTWHGIGQTIKGSVNSIIDTINKFIRQVNSMEINIPKVKVGKIEVGGGTIGMPNIPEIPRLAKGGITNGEMTAVIGDNPGGQEVVSPLSDLLGMVQTAVNTALMAGNQNNNTNTNQKLPDVVFNIDGQTFARITNAYAAKETTRIGGSMIQVF